MTTKMNMVADKADDGSDEPSDKNDKTKRNDEPKQPDHLGPESPLVAGLSLQTLPTAGAYKVVVSSASGMLVY